MTNKRVLVVSNNCFSPSNSNGRTLGNLFYGWPKENLAQFCVIAQDPAWDVCTNYYCLEDRTVLSAFKHCRKAVGRRLSAPVGKSKDENQVDTKRRNIGRKTLLKMMLREMVWAHNRWKSRDFERWVDAFNPNVVVLQFGDSSFMIDIALYIAQSRQIPLVVYNTEGYYFFDKFWYSSSCSDSLFFPFYKRSFHHRVKRLMNYACHSVYLNDELKDDYDYAFEKPSSVIYNSSSMQVGTPPVFTEGKIPVISYLGGLGHDRDLAITDVGKVLHEIDKRLYISVYGPADDSIKERLNAAIGVKYCGVVSYAKVQEVINNSDVLFHVEPTTGYNSQLRYAFSGKIADSVTSGKCFVLYAPKELACSKYIIDNRCGWFAEEKDDLRDVMLRVFNNEKERIEILNTAKVIAQRNHSFEGNAHKFQSILLNAK